MARSPRITGGRADPDKPHRAHLAGLRVVGSLFAAQSGIPAKPVRAISFARNARGQVCDLACFDIAGAAGTIHKIATTLDTMRPAGCRWPICRTGGGGGVSPYVPP